MCTGIFTVEMSASIICHMKQQRHLVKIKFKMSTNKFLNIRSHFNLSIRYFSYIEIHKSIYMYQRCGLGCHVGFLRYICRNAQSIPSLLSILILNNSNTSTSLNLVNVFLNFTHHFWLFHISGHFCTRHMTQCDSSLF